MSRASWPLVVVPYSLRIRPPRRSHLGRRRQRPGGLPPVTRGRGGGPSAGWEAGFRGCPRWSVKRRLIQTDVTQHRFSEHSCETLAQFPSAMMKHLRPQVSFSIPAYSVDAHYALANVLDQRPPYELSRLSNTYVLPKAQSKAQDRCFLRTSFGI